MAGSLQAEEPEPNASSLSISALWDKAGDEQTRREREIAAIEYHRSFDQ